MKRNTSGQFTKKTVGPIPILSPDGGPSDELNQLADDLRDQAGILPGGLLGSSFEDRAQDVQDLAIRGDSGLQIPGREEGHSIAGSMPEFDHADQVAALESIKESMPHEFDQAMADDLADHNEMLGVELAAAHDRGEHLTMRKVGRIELTVDQVKLGLDVFGDRS